MIKDAAIPVTTNVAPATPSRIPMSTIEIPIDF